MKIKLDYVKVGDYCLPDLTPEPQSDRSLGKYDLLESMMPGMAKEAGATGACIFERQKLY